MPTPTDPFGPGCPWYDLYERFGPPNVKWCEERLCALANEPANTWSNLGYIAVGVFIWATSSRSLSPLGKAFGIFVALMGLFSLVFHATNNYATQILDFVGMYLYAFLLLVLNLFRLGVVSRRTVLPLFLGLVVLATAMIPLSRAVGFPYQLIVFFAAVVIAVTELVQQRRGRRSGASWTARPFWIALGLFLVAVSFSIMDARRIVCFPESHVFQGHAMWHVVGAAAVYASFVYYRQFLPAGGIAGEAAAETLPAVP
jgi:hypothetical protein